MKISLPEHLLRVILLDNPWLEGAPIGPWQSRYLPEKYIHRTLTLKADHRICLVVGPRQAGKSTLLLTRSAQSFIDAYQPERFCVVSQQDHPSRKIGETQVCFISFSRVAEQVHIP
jgi:hypothetical protein